MYGHYKSSFRDDGTKTRWIVNINVRLLKKRGDNANNNNIYRFVCRRKKNKPMI